MEKLDIILWVMMGGFTIMFAIQLVSWTFLNKKIDNVEVRLTNRTDSVETNLSNRIDKLTEVVTDIDRRLCRLEGAFTSKDCCMLKADHSHKIETA